MDIWSWERAWAVVPDLLQGLLVTLQITVFGSLLAYVLGLIFAVIRRARIPVIDQVLWAFIEFIRSTPLLIQVFALFYLAPSAIGLTMSPFVTGVIAVGVHYACYTSEVYRAGIEAIPAGQWEAATALSLPRKRMWLGVILPQAVPRVIPALGNYTISMFKEIPLLFAIGVGEILKEARDATAATFSTVEPYTMAGLFFLILSYPASILVRRLERRVNRV